MNSVQLELLKLDKLWCKIVKQTPCIPLYVCLGGKQEHKMFEAYFNYQNSDEAKAKDIFIVLKYNFENKESYGKEFINDWIELSRIKKKMDGENDWSKGNIGDPSQVKTIDLLDFFYSLYNLYPELKDKKIFILLSPIDLNEQNIKEFEKWVAEWCSKNLKKDAIKLVVMDSSLGSFLTLPSDKYEFKINMDMAGLMHNVAEQTNKDKGSAETSFQQQIVSANYLLSKGNYDNAFAALEKAVKIAKTQNFKEGECTARFMMAGICLALEKSDEAESQFNKIFSITEPDTLFEAEMYMNYAGLLLSRSEVKKAIGALEKAADIAQKIDNKFIQMECYRMIGQFSDGIFASRTIPYYEKVIQIGEELEPEMRKSGTLPYTAMQLLNKYGQNSEKGKQLIQKMKDLVGDNWESLAKEPVLTENN